MVTKDDDSQLLGEALDRVITERFEQPAIVVDMSEGHGVRDVCRARAPRITHIAYPHSHGVSDSRNEVVRRARTRYLLFLDADALPTAGWATAMRRAFDRTDRVAVVGARCRARWHRPPPMLFQTNVAGDFLSLYDLGDQPLDVPRVIGTSYALDLTRVPAAPFPLELGFSRATRLAGEENAVCERALEDGWRVRYEPTALVLHNIKPERATWQAMLTRVYHAGQEGRRHGRRFDPLPRGLTIRDRFFQAAVGPAFLAGVAVGPRRRRAKRGER